jgi:site-specific DNA-methyltransferase (adenine-specific)
MTEHIVVLGDARRMSKVQGESVHLVVTSPPYWQLKDYGSRRQIGFRQSYEEYIDDLGKVWRECYRVLHPGCRLAINIGDQFSRATLYGRYKVMPIQAEIWRKCQCLGFDPMGTIIWQKVTTCNTSGGGTVMGSFPYPRNGILKIDYEHILLLRKPGEPPAVPDDVKDKARLTTEEWNQYFYGHWYFPGARQEEHIAVFPLELPRRLIRMFTFPGERVLDPFAGSGTTLLAARELGRSSIGYEIHPEFLPLIRKKLGFEGQGDLFLQEDSFKVVQASGAYSRRARGSPEGAPEPALPEPQGGYGSVIRKGDSRRREDYRRVSEVKDVRTFVLDSGEEVQLAGVLPNDRSEQEGMEFLKGFLRGQQVYVRRDGTLVYLHLKNRACVNSRLIRAGLADADLKSKYRLRRRFERYQAERS